MEVAVVKQVAAVTARNQGRLVTLVLFSVPLLSTSMLVLSAADNCTLYTERPLQCSTFLQQEP